MPIPLRDRRPRFMRIEAVVRTNDAGGWEMQSARATLLERQENVETAELHDVDWIETEGPLEQLAEAIDDERESIARDEARPSVCEHCRRDIDSRGFCFCDEADRQMEAERGN